MSKSKSSKYATATTVPLLFKSTFTQIFELPFYSGVGWREQSCCLEAERRGQLGSDMRGLWGRVTCEPRQLSCKSPSSSITYALHFLLQSSNLIGFFSSPFFNFLFLLANSVTANPKITIKGGSRHAGKSRKVLMMMKAAKLGWAGAGEGKKQGWTKSRARKGRS